MSTQDDTVDEIEKAVKAILKKVLVQEKAEDRESPYDYWLEWSDKKMKKKDRREFKSALSDASKVSNSRTSEEETLSFKPWYGSGQIMKLLKEFKKKKLHMEEKERTMCLAALQLCDFFSFHRKIDADLKALKSGSRTVHPKLKRKVVECFMAHMEKWNAEEAHDDLPMSGMVTKLNKLWVDAYAACKAELGIPLVPRDCGRGRGLATIYQTEEHCMEILTNIKNRHKKAIKSEVKAFNGWVWGDQLWKETSDDIGLATMNTNLTKIVKAFQGVEKRKGELREILRVWDPKLKTRVEALQLLTLMDWHIPEGFRNEANYCFEDRLTHLRNVCVGLKKELASDSSDEDSKEDSTELSSKKKNQKKTFLKSKIEALMNPDDGIKKRETEAFEDAIKATYGDHATPSIMSLGNYDPYFCAQDSVRAAFPEMMKRIAEANDAVMLRCYKMRDLGATIQQIEKALAHLPKNMWPLQLVDSVQAWRKTERSLQRERIFLVETEIMEAGKASNLNDLLKILKQLGPRELGISAKKIKDGFSDSEIEGSEALLAEMVKFSVVLEKLAEKIKVTSQETAQDVFDAEKVLEGALKKLKKDEIAVICTYMTGSIGWIGSLVEPSASAAGKAFAQVCPYLCAASCGVESVGLFKKAYRQKEKKDLAGEEMKRLEEVYKCSDISLMNAMKKEKNARQLQLYQTTATAVGAATLAAGGVAEMSGVGAPVGIAVKVVGGTIYYGNRAVFAGINWQKSHKTLEVLQQARAGNVEAMQTAFKHSGDHAYMYICLLTAEQHSFAVEFISQRDLCADDLVGKNNPMSLRIMRQALLEQSGLLEASQDRCKTLPSAVAHELLPTGAIDYMKKKRPVTDGKKTKKKGEDSDGSTKKTKGTTSGMTEVSSTSSTAKKTKATKKKTISSYSYSCTVWVVGVDVQVEAAKKRKQEL